MGNERNDPSQKRASGQGYDPARPAKETVGSPELHLVDLGQVSQDTALTISTGKFEILVRVRKQTE